MTIVAMSTEHSSSYRIEAAYVGDRVSKSRAILYIRLRMIKTKRRAASARDWFAPPESSLV
jgi:hypothetical protein